MLLKPAIWKCEMHLLQRVRSRQAPSWRNSCVGLASEHLYWNIDNELFQWYFRTYKTHKDMEGYCFYAWSSHYWLDPRFIGLCLQLLFAVREMRVEPIPAGSKKVLVVQSADRQEDLIWRQVHSRVPSKHVLRCRWLHLPILRSSLPRMQG